MSNKIDDLAYEEVDRLNRGISTIQASYAFLSKYLDEDEKEKYAKAFVMLEDISQTIECKLEDAKDSK